MGKSSFLMAMFNSYVKLPEGKYVYTWLVVSNMFYFPFHIWYSFPLTNSYFEKDGYCTTNQIHVYNGLFHMMIWYYIYTYISYIYTDGDDSTKTCSRKWWDDLEPGNAVTIVTAKVKDHHIDGRFIYPLVNSHITMENHHAINGKIHYK